MTDTMIFVNLPVADVQRATAFYKALGYAQHLGFSDESASSIVVSDHIVVMLLERGRFGSFLRDGAEIADGVEVLNCLSAPSRDAVDELVAKARAAGGGEWREPMDQGFMYGHSFTDPDGHVWEVVWMDPATVEQADTAGLAAA